jgi:WD40 repeat protein
LLGALEVSRDVQPRNALAFLIAEALRRFETKRTELTAGSGDIRVAYRPDGTEFATASADGIVTIWDTSGHSRVRYASPVPVRALAWSPDRPLLAVAREDGVLILWSVDAETWRELLGHRGAINAVQFSADGRRLATGGRDRTVRVWDVATGRARVLPEDHRSEVTMVAIRSNGDAIASASDGEVHAWFDQDGPNVAKTWPLRSHTGAITALRWSPDGTRLLTASVDGLGVVWDPSKGKMVVQPLRHESNVAILDAVFSLDGTRVLTCGEDRTARMWKLPEAPAADQQAAGAYEELKLSHTDTVVLVEAFEHQWIATAGNDRVVKVWTPEGRLIAQLEHTDAITSLAFSNAGKSIVIGTHDGKAVIWDFQVGVPHEAKHDLASPIRALATTRDGSVIAATEDSNLTTWRDSVERSVRGHLGRVLCTAVSPDGMLVASGGEGRALIWTARVGVPWGIAAAIPPRVLIDTPGTEITAIAFSPDSHTVVTGDGTGMVTWWNALTGERTAMSHRHAAPIRALAFSPSADLVAAASDAGVLLWDRWGNDLGTFGRQAVATLAFSPAGDRMVIGGRRDSAILRVSERRVAADTFLTGAGSVEAALITDGGLVVTGGSDHIVRIWDLETGRQLGVREPKSAIHALAFSASDSLLWTGTDDGNAQAWSLGASRDPVYVLALKKGLVRWKLDDGDVAAEKRREEW